LETQQDVDHFLDALKHELEDAIAKNERIQIR
jgi:cell division septum initiation protein DivIVA